MKVFETLNTELKNLNLFAKAALTISLVGIGGFYALGFMTHILSSDTLVLANALFKSMSWAFVASLGELLGGRLTKRERSIAALFAFQEILQRQHQFFSDACTLAEARFTELSDIVSSCFSAGKIFI
jgi:hypothetical protein